MNQTSFSLMLKTLTSSFLLNNQYCAQSCLLWLKRRVISFLASSCCTILISTTEAQLCVRIHIQMAQWPLPSIFAEFETYSRLSNWILEITAGLQPDSQTAVFKQFALQGVCVSSEKRSWTCFCPWQHVCLLFSQLNILMQTFHCFIFGQLLLRRPDK